MKRPPCEEGCNRAEFTLIDGDEVNVLCEPLFADKIIDMIRCNISFYLTMKDLPNGTLQVSIT